MSHGSTIANWQRQYNEEGFEGLSRSIGRSRSMTPNKKKIKPEKLNGFEREELIRLS
ncbi:helix-turn-helix domain-containing protein [Erysipelothrix rhusiopathiae]|uniref:helix-turn-helix domain-containing protein n=1 Tax=Erysipelothrix rhusiopathiae TaxID=1648 RepID=UPI003D34A50B